MVNTHINREPNYVYFTAINRLIVTFIMSIEVPCKSQNLTVQAYLPVNHLGLLAVSIFLIQQIPQTIMN